MVECALGIVAVGGHGETCWVVAMERDRSRSRQLPKKIVFEQNLHV